MKVQAALSFLIASAPISSCLAFSSSPFSNGVAIRTHTNFPSHTSLSNQAGDWNGEIVSNTDDGRIRGCSIIKVEGTISEWIVKIDGQEADLGKFSEQVYRKISADAKQQRFQGFRPGTIPPHLVPSYIGFTIEEVAKEATLEAMQQNNIRPFEDARNTFEFDTVSIMPLKKKGSKKKKKDAAPVEETEPQWLTFDTLKEATTAGWKVRS